MCPWIVCVGQNLNRERIHFLYGRTFVDSTVFVYLRNTSIEYPLCHTSFSKPSQR